jgi:hypothetical protein
MLLVHVGRRFLGRVLRLALTAPARSDLYRGVDKYSNVKAYFEELREVCYTVGASVD